MNASLVTVSALLCLALLHFLWLAAVVTTVVLVVSAALRRVSAHAQYVALTGGLLLLPLVFAGTIGWLCVAGPRIQQPSRLPILADGTIVDQSAEEAGLSVIYRLLPSAAAIDAAEVSVLSQPAVGTASAWMRFSPLLAAAYLLGVAILAGRLVVGLCGTRRLLRESAPLDEEALLAVVARHCQRLGLRAMPAVAWCRDVGVPTAIGVVRPAILLPLSAASGMTAGEIETILLHELVHIRRYDHVLVLAQRGIEVLFFFHPAVWLLSRRVSDIREHCCDDRVLALGIERQTYVESLLRAAELSLAWRDGTRPASMAAALAAVENPSRLRARVLRLMGEPAQASLKLRPAALAVLVGVLAIVLVAPLAVKSFAQGDSESHLRDVAQTVENPSQSGQPQASAAPDESENASAASGVALDVAQRWNVNDPLSLLKLIATHQRVHLQGHTDCRSCHHDAHQSGHSRDAFAEPMDLTRGNASRFREQFGSQFLVRVKGTTAGTVWGTDVYTDDSSVGMAAVHAGLVKPDEEAVLVLTIVRSPARHVGSSRHGVTSHAFDAFPSSFMLHKPPEADVSREDAAAPLASGSLKQLTDLDLTFREWNVEVLSLKSKAKTSATPFRGKFGRRFEVEVVGRTDGSVWGTDVYTDDSDIATAAVHAGIIAPGERAVVTIVIIESPEEHTSSVRHGVTSSGWGSYPSSYIVLKKAPATKPQTAPSPATAYEFRDKLGRRFEIEVVGSTEGTIWGTDVYTHDSPIATAAVHAGLVKPGERATVILTMVESPMHHEGSTRNGVTSRKYDSYHSSYILSPSPANRDAPSRDGVPR